MESGEQREQLQGMARHWDELAGDRAALIPLHPKLALEGEEAEESNVRG